MTASTYVLGEDTIAVAWDELGPYHVLDRDGTVTEQYCAPDGEPITADLDALERLNDDALYEAVERLRECPAAKRLSGKTLDALADAVRGEQ